MVDWSFWIYFVFVCMVCGEWLGLVWLVWWWSTYYGIEFTRTTISLNVKPSHHTIDETINEETWFGLRLIPKIVLTPSFYICAIYIRTALNSAIPPPAPAPAPPYAVFILMDGIVLYFFFLSFFFLFCRFFFVYFFEFKMVDCGTIGNYSIFFSLYIYICLFYNTSG